MSIEHIPPRMRAALEGDHPESPPFIPAIYEHKAWFIGRTPVELARDAGLLAAAVLEEFGRLEADAVTIGLDVYNIEAEALGSRVTYPAPGDPGVPVIAPGGHALVVGGDVPPRTPNPLRDGRMPVMVEAARRVVREVGQETWVRGALSGPFSLAVNLAGMDAMFVGLMTQPDDVRALLDFCVDVVHEFGKAFADVGAGVAVFDSLASPDLLSPAHYREFVAPATSALIERLHTLGLEYVPVIIGGDTSAIAGDIVASGANNVLCDFSAEWEAWLETAESAGVAVRRNIEPSLLSEGTAEAVFERMTALRQEGASYPGFIGGTAVVPYGAPLENLLAARDACRASGSGGGVAEPA